jgi:hypothetical protein
MCSVRNACGITNSKNTHSKYVTHFFSIFMKAAEYFVTRTLPMSLYWQVLWMNFQPNIDILLASAPVVRFIFVCTFLRWDKFNRQRSLSYILKCMNALHKCPKYYLFRFVLKISKSVSFSVQASSTHNRQQYLHYSNLAVLCSIYNSPYDLPYGYLRHLWLLLHLRAQEDI